MSGIVVGVDGSANATTALDWAMSEAATRKTSLTVLAVHSVPAGYWYKAPLTLPGDEAVAAELRKTVEAAVEEAAARTGARPDPVTVVAINGFPAQALIDASKNADLVVVGARGGGGFTALVMGSVSSQVVQHAACPVVVVRAAR